MLENSCVYSSVPAAVVTIGVLNQVSRCPINRKAKCFEQIVFL